MWLEIYFLKYYLGNLYTYITNLHNQRLNENDTKNFLLQILDGVRVVHENKFIHRDLKPENILITKDNILKVADFGLSKPLNTNQLTCTDAGSALYKAPEIYCEKKYNHQVDMWSLGCILFFMLTGNDAFEGMSEKIIYQNIISKCPKQINLNHPEFDKFKDIFKELSPQLKDLLQKILTINPKNRIIIKIAFSDIYNHPFLLQEQNIERQKKNQESKIFYTTKWNPQEDLINYAKMFFMIKTIFIVNRLLIKINNLNINIRLIQLKMFRIKMKVLQINKMRNFMLLLLMMSDNRLQMLLIIYLIKRIQQTQILIQLQKSQIHKRNYQINCSQLMELIGEGSQGIKDRILLELYKCETLASVKRQISHFDIIQRDLYLLEYSLTKVEVKTNRNILQQGFYCRELMNLLNQPHEIRKKWGIDINTNNGYPEKSSQNLNKYLSERLSKLQLELQQIRLPNALKDKNYITDQDILALLTDQLSETNFETQLKIPYRKTLLNYYHKLTHQEFDENALPIVLNCQLRLLFCHLIQRIFDLNFVQTHFKTFFAFQKIKEFNLTSLEEFLVKAPEEEIVKQGKEIIQTYFSEKK